MMSKSHISNRRQRRRRRIFLGNYNLWLVILALQCFSHLELTGRQPTQAQSIHTPSAPPPTPKSIRVASVHAQYGRYRVSQVGTASPTTPPMNQIPYNASTGEYYSRFRYRFTHLEIHSQYVDVVPGAGLSTTLLSDGTTVQLKLPVLGAPSRGVIIADPCIPSSNYPCPFGNSYQTLQRLTWIVHAASSDSDFWGILGDDLYDLDGSVSATFYEHLSERARAVPLVTTLGNHDLWYLGGPPANSQYGTSVQADPDPMGYGFAQFYGTDTIASHVASNGGPFNFSMNPDLAENLHSYNVPGWDNFFFYYAIGGFGFIGYSGAHPIPLSNFAQACTYFTSGEAQAVPLVLLVGHWWTADSGCAEGYDVPTLFSTLVSSVSPCSQLAFQQRFAFVMGHRHANQVWNKGQGFLVGAAGNMDRTLPGEFGFPLFELHLDPNGLYRFEVTYFLLAENSSDSLDSVDARFNRLQACFNATGQLSLCKGLGLTWANSTVFTPSTFAPTQAPTFSPASRSEAIALGVILIVLAIFILFCMRCCRGSKSFFGRTRETQVGMDEVVGDPTTSSLRTSLSSAASSTPVHGEGMELGNQLPINSSSSTHLVEGKKQSKLDEDEEGQVIVV